MFDYEQKAAYASILCALKIRDELGEYDSNPKVYAVAMPGSCNFISEWLLI